jgi:hypothetical protein
MSFPSPHSQPFPIQPSPSPEAAFEACSVLHLPTPGAIPVVLLVSESAAGLDRPFLFFVILAVVVFPIGRVLIVFTIDSPGQS